MHKILFITNGYFPAKGFGGPLTSVKALAESIVKKGIDVTIIAPNSDVYEPLNLNTYSEYNINNVIVKYFNVLKLFRINTLFKIKILGPHYYLWLILNIKKYSHIHIQISFIPEALILSAICKLLQKKLYYSSRGVLDYNRQKYHYGFLKLNYIKWIEYTVIKYCSKYLILNSEELKLAYKLNVNTCRINNGIDFTKYKSNNDIKYYKSKYRLKLLYFAQLINWKGIFEYLDSLTLLSKKNVNYEAIIAGPDTGNIAHNIRKIIEKHKLNCQYIGNISNVENKSMLLRQSNIFILPTVSEGQSMSIIEAIYFGNIVLTTKESYIDFTNKNFFIRINKDGKSIYEKLIFLNKLSSKEIEKIFISSKSYAKNFSIDQTSNHYLKAL